MIRCGLIPIGPFMHRTTLLQASSDRQANGERFKTYQRHVISSKKTPNVMDVIHPK
jgi:hypothetical protein